MVVNFKSAASLLLKIPLNYIRIDLYAFKLDKLSAKFLSDIIMNPVCFALCGKAPVATLPRMNAGRMNACWINACPMDESQKEE
jgi:hypothetical protein